MKAIMVQGTASDVGKSVLCTALCRWLLEEGLRVAPFKAQNMALNSAVTRDGGEIGRSQAVQAEAAGAEACVDMNPILLKPKGDRISEVIVHGRHYRDMAAGDYQAHTHEMLQPVRQSLDRLSQRYDVLVVEGAGSPAEVNLKERDIVNMRTAELVDAPVLLVADIDRGGVFASLIGTLEILEPHERARVRGLVINKFRGDRSLLEPGLKWLYQRTGIPVLGVLPYRDPGIDPEDSLALDSRKETGDAALEVAVIRFPRISNFTDFAPLEGASDVRLRYVSRVSEWGNPDVVILPGTKNTIADLFWLRQSGLLPLLEAHRAQGGEIVGICGGYQMMGVRLHDPDGVEWDDPDQEGLRWLPVATTFRPGKRTAQVRARGLAPGWGYGLELEGYEIHLGREDCLTGAIPLLEREDGTRDGCVNDSGRVWGTHLHGLFQSPAWTRSWLNHLRQRKGLPPLDREEPIRERDQIYAALADWLREHLDLEAVRALIERKGVRR
ncbi:cobyric acid synthase [Desmospora profundinema]|uniref:Cobyric acid synthase n=1 Tax=Desmospora profundinema TaxID=1571184 RepID=A0ABU1IPM7_9BACL|nr:cobyric acid synthase [Desmospora profundinema]MDR6226104.1 adenosylcobyric acid synthase [Desmospora profundinema]